MKNEKHDLLVKYLDIVNLYLNHYLKMKEDRLVDLLGEKLTHVNSQIDIAQDNLSSLKKRLGDIIKKYDKL